MDVTVKRSKWYRGQGVDFSRLLVTDKTIEYLTDSVNKAFTGQMCCLGFAALACGYTKEEIADKESPANLSGASIRMSEVVDISGHNNYVCLNMMRCNDAVNSSDSERETRLTELGLKVGINFIFVD